MPWFNANVNFLACRQRLQRGTAGDQVLRAPTEVNHLHHLKRVLHLFPDLGGHGTSYAQSVGCLTTDAF